MATEQLRLGLLALGNPSLCTFGLRTTDEASRDLDDTENGVFACLGWEG